MAIPEHNELASLLHHVAFAQASNRAFLRVTGSDATRWLNGMVTNAAATLLPGEGNYNFLLNAQGRIQGDCLLFREAHPPEPAAFLLATDGAQIEAITGHLDRYIIMDDVELSPAFADESDIMLLGPEAPQALARLHLPALDPSHLALADTPHGAVLVLASPGALVPRYELRAPAATLAALCTDLQNADIPEVGPEILEGLRLLEGTPRFGTDIRDRELPQETAQAHALHFAKGCYLGQEIVERIHSRGQVHRTFTVFTLEGSLPSLPATLQVNGKPAGELTSAAAVALENGPALLALGYCRREALDTHATLTYPGGTAMARVLLKPKAP